MDYNSTRERLAMPEYGRLVQDMVHHALTIADRNERQTYAKAIITVMAGVNPGMKNVPDFRRKLWDHLAFMANYQLDIDYPFPITHYNEEKEKPHLAYPGHEIKWRHYGHLIEEAVKSLTEMPDTAQRRQLLRQVGTRMKRSLAEWKGDGVEDAKVARDIAAYTEGALAPDFSRPGMRLMEIREQRNKKGKKGNNH